MPLTWTQASSLLRRDGEQQQGYLSTLQTRPRRAHRATPRRDWL